MSDTQGDPDEETEYFENDSFSELGPLSDFIHFGPVTPGSDDLLHVSFDGVKIVRLIAEGGMGRVYEAKQEKPHRTVAVKVMRPGLTSPSVLKRFEYEAEVLGQLQHPGIAHIYSVGVHSVGNATVPYFVMEYIAGARTLTAYANELKLSTRQRLDLFRCVCDAVAHGHQKGVIHRDLKPSNILVDAAGQPKVIDFGVARSTNSDVALTTMQTDVGQLIGTLQYMSPEQFKADPNGIDVRSDVYALGVVLYELVAGKMPYDVKKKAIHEIARIVQQEDPTPLSSFNRALRGDVAVIAGKCLEKDRSRRYSTASELGADIKRYLAGEPIVARPLSFVDSMIRLGKRHRAAFAAVVGVSIALVVAVIGIGVFASQAEEARVEAEKSKTAAVSQRELVKQKEEEAEKARVEADKSKTAAITQRELVKQKEKEAAEARAGQKKEQQNARSLIQGVVAVAQQWAASKRPVTVLNELTVLPPELAEELVTGLRNVKADLQLNGLTELELESAKHLARYRGNLYLNGLRSLSDDAANALATHTGVVHLEKMTTLSDQAAERLRSKKGIKLNAEFK